MSFESPIFINGAWAQTREKLDIFSPFDHKKVGSTFKAGAEEIEIAIRAAEEAFKKTRRMPVYERAEKLHHIAEGIFRNALSDELTACQPIGIDLSV